MNIYNHEFADVVNPIRNGAYHILGRAQEAGKTRQRGEAIQAVQNPGEIGKLLDAIKAIQELEKSENFEMPLKQLQFKNQDESDKIFQLLDAISEAVESVKGAVPKAGQGAVGRPRQGGVPQAKAGQGAINSPGQEVVRRSEQRAVQEAVNVQKSVAANP
jgi:hypothetical protein